MSISPRLNSAGGIHLVSLLRYVVAINRVRRASAKQAARGAMRRDAALRLGRCIELLPDIHDCPSLFTRIARSPEDALLHETEAGTMTCLMVKADLANDKMSTFEIEPDAAVLLSRFERPRRYADLRAEFAEDAAWTWSEIRKLHAKGLPEMAS